MSVSVVDFRGEGAVDEFTQSLVNTGFAVLRNHPVAISLVDELYAEWLNFFNDESKFQYLFDEASHAGFIPFERSETAKGASIKDLKEFYHYFPGKQCPDSLLSVTQRAYSELETLSLTLLNWVESVLPSTIREQLAVPLSDMVHGSTHTLLRVIHYPPIGDDIEPGAVRAAAHEDINLLTLLPAATAKGLQVKTREGVWLDVPCEPGWLIVNVGDMLAECTRGYYKATSHRVINPSCEYAKQPRVSSPLFLHPREDVVLSERYTAGSYRDERFRELGLRKETSD